MKKRSVLCLSLCACVLAGRLGFPASARAETAPASPASAVAPATDDKKPVAYKLSRTDKISISVVGEVDLNVAQTTIDVNGNVNLSLVQDVHVAGLTVNEAQTAIENAYRDGRFLRNPQVHINVEDYAPRVVFVTGLVKNSGTYNIPVETIMTLRELISKAGGVAETANLKDVRITRNGPDGKPMVLRKNIDGLLTGKANASATDANFPIEPDDQVYVPEKIF